MRNLKRLSIEIQVLQRIYGYQNVTFSKDAEWIFIKNFKLPNGKYNMNSCSVLIIVPENFDDAEVTECYVDKNLKW
ncbi:MAG: E2/UBC family protein, partial [candidate division WOR-3 bacterium]